MSQWDLVSDAAVPVALQRVASDDRIPDAVDVVVIGGGIIGASAAYYLSTSGYKVALVEKGFVGAEQSSRNWGWCRQQNRDERELPLVKASLELWGSLNEELGAETGFRRNGLLYVTDSPAELEGWRKWVSVARGYDVNSTILTAQQARDLAPHLAGNWIGGVHSPTDGQAEPMLAASALATAARRLGATIHQQCAARGLSVTNGRVDGVVTEKGTIRTDAVLCAAGAWASMFCGRYGVHLPQSGASGTVFSTGPAPALIKSGFSTPQFTVRPNLDQTYTVAIRGKAQIDITPQSFIFMREFWRMFRERYNAGVDFRVGRSFFEGPGSIGRWKLDGVSPFERLRVVNPSPDERAVEAGMAALIEAYPEFRGVKVDRKWAGWIDSTPDGIPVISDVPGIAGFHLAAGFSGHGFGVGPAAGKLAADLIASRPPIVDPSGFDIRRFARGKAPGKVAQF